MSTVPVERPTAVPPWADELVQLYRDHYDGLVRLAYLVSGRAEHAEELVQDAFLRTHRAWSSVRDPLPYLRTAVFNGCRSLGRRERLEHDRRPPPAAPATQEPDELWDALAALNDRQRAAIVLRFYVDLPEADIAAVLGCRPATVRSSVHRALAKLRKEIAR